MDNLMENQMRVVVTGTFVDGEGVEVDVRTTSFCDDEEAEHTLAQILLTTAAVKAMLLDGRSKEKVAEILMNTLDTMTGEANDA